MTQGRFPWDKPDPDRHDRPGRRINPDRITRADVEQLIPGLDIDALTAHEREVIREVIAESLRSAAQLCEWIGCTRPATEQHHTLEQAVGGRLAHYAPLVWYCDLHHEAVTILRNASLRAEDR
jgi:hypothetical protein